MSYKKNIISSPLIFFLFSSQLGFYKQWKLIPVFFRVFKNLMTIHNIHFQNPWNNIFTLKTHERTCLLENHLFMAFTGKIRNWTHYRNQSFEVIDNELVKFCFDMVSRLSANTITWEWIWIYINFHKSSKRTCRERYYQDPGKNSPEIKRTRKHQN
jgi:hypothetical protein